MISDAYKTEFNENNFYLHHKPLKESNSNKRSNFVRLNLSRTKMSTKVFITCNYFRRQIASSYIWKSNNAFINTNVIIALESRASIFVH